MLKNMKVGTKLIAVLVAPVLVLLILAASGSASASSTASSTQRVEQLAQMAAVDANLAHELQREAIYSAAYMASGGTQWKDELATQRTATDAAIDDLQDHAGQDQPGQGLRRPEQGRRRRSTTGSATSTPSAARSTASRPRPPRRSSQFDSRPRQDLAKLNTAIAQAADDPTLSRGLTTFANLNRLKTARPTRPPSPSALVQVGYFPKTWPSAGQAPVPCDVVSTSGCDVYGDLTVATGDSGNAENIFNDSATA